MVVGEPKQPLIGLRNDRNHAARVLRRAIQHHRVCCFVVRRNFQEASVLHRRWAERDL